jgi:hypothetical protein
MACWAFNAIPLCVKPAASLKELTTQICRIDRVTTAWTGRPIEKGHSRRYLDHLTGVRAARLSARLELKATIHPLSSLSAIHCRYRWLLRVVLPSADDLVARTMAE